jgi:predicted nucleotidyltransferase
MSKSKTRPRERTREHVLEILRQELPYLTERYGVVRIAVYGSFARGTPTRKSDVDLLVKLARPLGLEFVALTGYLEERLGCKVDLATFETLDRSLTHPRRAAVAQEIQRTLAYVQTTG